MGIIISEMQVTATIKILDKKKPVTSFKKIAFDSDVFAIDKRVESVSGTQQLVTYFLVYDDVEGDGFYWVTMDSCELLITD